MSQKRFHITKEMIIGIFEDYAKNNCIDQKCSSFYINNSEGETIMTIEISGRLLDDVKNELNKKQNK